MPKRASPLAWSKEDGGKRGGRRRAPTSERTRKLTRQGIVDAAVRLADSEGLDAVSIRRLAAEFDVNPMSLYVHIATKDDLLALMMDEVVGMMLVEKPLSDEWREALREVATKAHAAYVAHPWVLQAFARGSVLGPNALQRAKQLGRAVAGVGVAPADVWTLNYINHTLYFPGSGANTGSIGAEIRNLGAASFAGSPEGSACMQKRVGDGRGQRVATGPRNQGSAGDQLRERLARGTETSKSPPTLPLGSRGAVRSSRGKGVVMT